MLKTENAIQYRICLFVISFLCGAGKNTIVMSLRLFSPLQPINHVL